jgi:hypothetical protein
MRGPRGPQSKENRLQGPFAKRVLIFGNPIHMRSVGRTCSPQRITGEPEPPEPWGPIHQGWGWGVKRVLESLRLHPPWFPHPRWTTLLAWRALLLQSGSFGI